MTAARGGGGWSARSGAADDRGRWWGKPRESWRVRMRDVPGGVTQPTAPVFSFPSPPLARTWNCWLVVVCCVALEGRARITRARCPVYLSWCVCLFIVAFWEIPDASNGSRARGRLHSHSGVASGRFSARYPPDERLPQSSSLPSHLAFPLRSARSKARPFKASFAFIHPISNAKHWHYAFLSLIRTWLTFPLAFSSLSIRISCKHLGSRPFQLPVYLVDRSHSPFHRSLHCRADGQWSITVSRAICFV